MFRVPTALTSSSLPGLMCGSRASPGDGRESVLATAGAAAGAAFGVDAAGVFAAGAVLSDGWAAGVVVVVEL